MLYITVYSTAVGDPDPRNHHLDPSEAVSEINPELTGQGRSYLGHKDAKIQEAPGRCEESPGPTTVAV